MQAEHVVLVAEVQFAPVLCRVLHCVSIDDKGSLKIDLMKKKDVFFFDIQLSMVVLPQVIDDTDMAQ